MTTKVQHPYRIEERGWSGLWPIPAMEFDDRDTALKLFGALLITSREVRRRHPEVRLVLLGPDRTILPGGAR